MAKLYLKFEQSILKEYDLKPGSSFSIGRLPDNSAQIDNLSVSGHHARVTWENGHYVLEDINSLNGTYLNNRRISRTPLKDGDTILVGKHTLSFSEEGGAAVGERFEPAATGASAPVPAMDSTVVLDTRKAKEMLAHAGGPGIGAAAVPAKERIGVLNVMHGKTDQREYILTGKLTVIGKSAMASIKLKGWFAPKVAAVISKRDGRYLIAPDKGVKVSVSGRPITSQSELNEGDLVEVAGVKLSFSFTE